MSIPTQQSDSSLVTDTIKYTELDRTKTAYTKCYINSSPMFQAIGHHLDGDHRLRLQVAGDPLHLVDPHSPPAVDPHHNLQDSDRRRTTTTGMTTKTTTTMTMLKTIRVNNFILN